MWANQKLGWMLVLSLVGCGSEHQHGEEGFVDTPAHHVRDLATEPCSLETWQALMPDLRECALTGSVLNAVNLRRVNLSDAILENASLEGSDLFKASLVNANLRRANLRGTNLTSADLSAADLTDADLRGARLTNASFAGASLTGALTDATTVCVSGSTGPCP